MPSLGQCDQKGDKQIEYGQDCTWRIEERVKTIEGKCLFENLKDSCMSVFQGKGIKKAESIFVNAFQYEEQSEGGCPAINPPATVSRSTKKA